MAGTCGGGRDVRHRWGRRQDGNGGNRIGVLTAPSFNGCPGFTSDGRAGEHFQQLLQPALQKCERGLDVGTVSPALGCASPPPLHPREPRHHDLLPEQEVPHFARGVPAAAAAEQGLPLYHAPRGAEMVRHPGAGRHGAAGRRGAVPGPADRSHAGGLGEEPALRPHGVHDGPGGGAADAAAAVVPRTAGHRLLRGRELPGPALRAVARNPLLVGKHGEDRGPHPLPGDHEELRPPRRVVRGRHQPHGEPAVRPGAPVRVPGEDDAAQPSPAERVGPRAAPGARLTVHQRHRGRLHRSGQLCRGRHRSQPEAALVLTWGFRTRGLKFHPLLPSTVTLLGPNIGDHRTDNMFSFSFFFF
ncbi:uncharacterized protein LOC126947140 isoform X1 [Macaca thibetana thibetana]|uniref:uncharacterized protein LOC126946852 isoform X1 n=1 Tax=Macaca thibetana thibetana TaxID=257877 RepID=UPI0021BC8A79|nr:uncharacterized protein LOC126946852 isoform X1 [Macaca thibetana thibetana]XP_050633724.1 uncharacterized protein LOC126947140 isoform X1 [Macaca thibetana thibetana]